MKNRLLRRTRKKWQFAHQKISSHELIQMGRKIIREGVLANKLTVTPTPVIKKKSSETYYQEERCGSTIKPNHL